jgi:hypothetical protein
MVDHVSATLNYLAPWSARNRLYVAPGDHLTTTEYDPRAVAIADGRGRRDEFTLDRTGFALVDHRSPLPPAPDVHVDLHTSAIAYGYARVHAKSALTGREYRRAVYTSLWRTFSPPPQDWPLLTSA